MRATWIALICALMPICAVCQSLHVDNEELNWEGGLDGGLNRDGWQWHGWVAYFPIQYIGMKAGLGMAGEVVAIADWGHDEWETGHHYTQRLRFSTAVPIRSPRIINLKSQDAGLYLFAEPGCVLSPGASGSHRARIFCVELRAGINFQINRVVASLGYSVSNFSLYSGNPDSQWRFSDDHTESVTHTVFAAIACKF